MPTTTEADTPTKRGPRVVTEEHKAAMSMGRNRSRTIDAYLSALANRKPVRGRPVNAEALQAKIDDLTGSLATMKPTQRLLAIQEIENAKARLKTLQNSEGADTEALEKEFVQVAGDYSAAKGITRAVWRAFGVPAKVLDEAGIK